MSAIGVFFNCTVFSYILYRHFLISFFISVLLICYFYKKCIVLLGLQHILFSFKKCDDLNFDCFYLLSD